MTEIASIMNQCGTKRVEVGGFERGGGLNSGRSGVRVSDMKNTVKTPNSHLLLRRRAKSAKSCSRKQQRG